MAGITTRPKLKVVVGDCASWGIQITWSGTKISAIIPFGQASMDGGTFGNWTITYAYFA